MKLSAWRITKQKHGRSAFSGEGARLFGGRWNSPGTPMIYTAQSQSLAILEVLVHLDSPELLKKYLLFEVKIDSACVADLDLAGLPEDWQADPVPPEVQTMGDKWIAGERSVALRVPSALVPAESSYLLNPHHPDFGKLRTSKSVPFHFDARLARR